MTPERHLPPIATDGQGSSQDSRSADAARVEARSPGLNHLETGMALFADWFASGEGPFDALHERFKAWGTHDERMTVRSLFSIAHGEGAVR